MDEPDDPWFGGGRRWLSVADEPQSGLRDRRTAFAGAALVAATLGVFAHACANDFINCDDPQYVTDNPHVLGGLTAADVGWAFTSTEVFNWHPLTWLSLQLDQHLFGPRVWGYHLTNVLLHAANALLLFAVFRRMTGAVWRSAVLAGLFALHPLHVESVAWVAERKDVLSTFFGLLAVAAYVGYARRPGLGRYLLVFLATGLSLMAKSMLVTLPGLLLLLDYWPLERLRPVPPGPGSATPPKASLFRLLGIRILEKLPLAALAAGAGAMTVVAQHGGGAMASLADIPLGQRAGNAAVCYVRYLVMAVWPAGLAPFYPHPREALPSWQVAGAVVLLAGVSALALAEARRRPYLAVGWLWYLGTLLPVIGLVQVGLQGYADRYTYVPLVGPCLMAVWGLAELAERRPVLRPLIAAGAAAALLAFAARTWVQVTVWRDSRTLWEESLRVTGENYWAEGQLGGACLFGQGTPAEAEAHFRTAVRLNPDYTRGWGLLGVALDKQGKLEEATECFSRCLELDPGLARMHYNLAAVLARRGRFDEALAHFQEAARLEPDFAEAQQSAAFLLARAGRLEEAISAARECVRAEPDAAPYHEFLAKLLRQHGDEAEAAAELREARRLRDPFSGP